MKPKKSIKRHKETTLRSKLLLCVFFEMKPDAKADVDRIPDVLKDFEGEMSLRAGTIPTFVLNLSGVKKKQKLEKIETAIDALNGLIIA